MKKPYFLLLAFVPLFLSAQTWEWAKSYAVPNTRLVNYGTGISRDKNNNIYITGSTYMPGGGPNTGWGYNWLKKFDAKGTFIWSDTIPFYSDTKNITDDNGNTYIIGVATIAKYDGNGNELWIRYIPRVSLSSISFLNEDVIITGCSGSFTSSVGSTTLSSGTGFLAKCDYNGNWLWVKTMTDFAAQATKITSNNLIIITGDPLKNTADSSTIRVFDENGQFLKGFLKLKYPAGGITVDSKNNIYVIGEINKYQPLVIDGNIINCDCENGNSAYIIKFDSEGIYQWHKIIKKYINVSKLLCDKEDNIYVAGNIIRTLQIDSFLLDNKVSSVYVAKFKSTGVVDWIEYSEQPSPNVGSGQLNDMILDTDEKPVITGAITDKHIFDGITVTATDNLYSDVLIAKIKQEQFVGVSEIKQVFDNGLSIYPNPTHGFFMVSYKAGQATDISINVINYLGQTVIKNHYASKTELTETFDLSRLARGVYFIQLKTDTATEVRKIVLE